MKKIFKGRRILVTAGPTREYLDPVRFLSNPSTGKMGTAIASWAAKQGAKVTLVLGPVAPPLAGALQIIPVISAEQMYRAVMRQAPRVDIIIMTAAVSDYRPKYYSQKKIKKQPGPMTLELIRTPDILAALGKKKKPNQLLIGFAAETDHLLKNAREKLKRKNLDLIIANRVGTKNSGFASDKNQIWLLFRDGKTYQSARLPKKTLARLIIKEISQLLSN